MAAPDLDPTTKLKGVPWYLWFAAGAVFLAPVYILESGNPQPTDVLTLIFLFGVLLRHNGRLRFPPYAALFVFTLMLLGLWVAVVDVFWSWFYLDPIILKPISYFWFNILVIIVFIGLFHEHGIRLHRGLVHVLFSTLVYQLLLLPFLYDPDAKRQELLFNNPNQVAYYAVCCSSILAAVNQRIKFTALYQTVFYALSMALVIVSVSRGGMASLLVLLVCVVWNRPKLLFLAGIALTLCLAYAQTFPDFYDFFQSRIFDSSTGTDRGYSRMLEHPMYMIFGAGEWAGGHQTGTNIELHSNIGTMLYCYGIFGLFLYFVLHVEILRRLPPSSYFLLVPTLVMGLFHKGTRFTLYWINLGVLMTLWSSSVGSRLQLSDLGLEEPGE